MGKKQDQGFLRHQRLKQQRLELRRENFKKRHDFDNLLNKAINNGNMNDVNTTLSSLSLYETKIFGNFLYLALSQNPVNEAIIDALLNAQNKEKNPFFNINSKNKNEPTPLFLLLTKEIGGNFTPKLRIQLLTKFLNHKDAQGRYLIKLDSSFHNIPLLLQAPDLAYLNLLLSLKTVNGKPACDVNEIYHDQSILDHVAEKNNPDMVETVKNHGGKTRLECIAQQLKTAINNDYKATTIQRDRDIRSITAIINFNILNINPENSIAKNRIGFTLTPKKLITQLQTKRDQIEANHRYYSFLWLGFTQPPSRLVMALDAALAKAHQSIEITAPNSNQKKQ